MVLNPIPFKESKTSGKKKFIDKGEKGQSSGMSDNDKTEESGESLELKSEPSNSCNPANDDGVETTGKGRKRLRRSEGKGTCSPPSSSSSNPPQRKARRQSQATKQRRFSDNTTTSENSPYFKKKIKSSPYFKNQTENERCSSGKAEGKQYLEVTVNMCLMGRSHKLGPRKEA